MWNKSYIHYDVIMSYLLILSQLLVRWAVMLIIRISSSSKHITSPLSFLIAQKVKCTASRLHTSVVSPVLYKQDDFPRMNVHTYVHFVCELVHIKDPMLLLKKSIPCSGGSGFPLWLSLWSFTIYPTS